MRALLSVFLVAFWVEPAFSEELSWQGEWSWQDGKRWAGLTVSECHGDGCQFKYFGLGCDFSGTLRTEHGQAVGVVKDYVGRAKDCRITLKQEKASALDASLKGANCKDFCGETFTFPPHFRLRSKKPYLTRYKWFCYDSTAPAMETWCTSPDLQKLDEQFAETVKRIDGLLERDTYKPRSDWFDAIINDCSKHPEATEACLTKQYQTRLVQLESEEKAAHSVRDQRYMELLARGDGEAAKKKLAEIAGVYKRRFTNGRVDGTKYESEDILEIVPVTDDTAYFKTSLQFYNGHSCGLFGLARYNKAGNFVFVDQSNGHQGCILQIEPSATEIRLIDDKEKPCRDFYCGARGAFTGITFLTKLRRPIRYMKLLKNSGDFKTSLEKLDSLPVK